MFFIKFYHEVLHDPKMGRLPDRLWRRFFELCLMAGEQQDGGNVPNTADMAWTLHMDEGELVQDLEAMAAIGLISSNEDGTWFVTNFAKRQRRIPVNERVARYREQQRKDTYYGNESLPQPSNEPVTIRYTEQETDTEQETETETETTTDAGVTTPDAAAVAAVLAGFGMSSPDIVAREAPGYRAKEVEELIDYARTENLGPGWVRSELRAGHRAPPKPVPKEQGNNRRRFIEGEYAELIEH